MYEITITKTTVVERPFGKEWKETGHTQGCGCEKYSYTPETTKKQERSYDILRMKMDEIDLSKIMTTIITCCTIEGDKKGLRIP